MEELFYVQDLGQVVSLMDTWTCHLPNVVPYYAVKSNQNPTFLAAIAALDAGYDCKPGKPNNLSMDCIAKRTDKSLDTIFGAPGIREKKVTHIFRDELTKFIQSIILQNEEMEELFYVLDLGQVVSLMDTWTRHLPNIVPYYAVKCNQDPTFLAAMAALGASFDCASQVEIKTIMSLGVSPDRIIFANTCKTKSHIKYAASAGVKLATFDSKEEITKMKNHHKDCRLLIRIKIDDGCDAKYPLDSKCGALPNEIEPLLLAAKASGVTVSGVAFHIGSVVTNPSGYGTAIAIAKAVFDLASRLGLGPMHVIDIGGGFTNTMDMFEESARIIKASIDNYFGELEYSNLTVIAEPGRFFAEPAFTLAAIITGKRIRGELREYWINDGTHGSMHLEFNTSSSFNPVPFACKSSRTNPACLGKKQHKSMVYGPTCDPRDIVVNQQQLPELEVDDWLLFQNMGAYKASVGNNFNGFITSAIPTLLVYSVFH